MVLVGLLGVTLATTHIYTTGVMIGPIEQEFGWSRAQISSGQTIMSFVGVFMVPTIGVAVDRFGPRRIALVGSSVYCLMIALLSTVSANLWTWWLGWIGIALGAAFIGPTVWSAAVSSLFARKRGMALAITLCGTGVGAGLMPNLAALFVDLFGWRLAYAAIAGLWALILVPMIFFCFSSAADQIRRAKIPATGPSSAASATLAGLTVRQGLSSRGYIVLVAASAVYTLSISGITINLVPILISHGLTRETAASLTAMLAIGIIIGRVSSGYLFDRFDAKLVTGIGTSISVFPTMALLFWPGSTMVSAVAVMIYGIVLGPTINGMAYLATRYIGLRSYGTLFGLLMGLLMLMSGLSPMLVNHIYDVTRSYQLVLTLTIPGALLAGTLFMLMGRCPDFGKMPGRPA